MRFLIANFDIDENNDYRDKPQQQTAKRQRYKRKKGVP